LLSGLVLVLMSSVLVANTVSAQEFKNPSRKPRSFGDSTAAGQGADYEQGIAVLTAQKLAASHRVTMTNFGISGARANDVVEKELPRAEKLTPDVVLISVSANDVVHLTSVSAVRESLETIIKRLRTANPKVKIVVTGAPEMAAPPRIPWLLRPIAGWRTAQMNEMFHALTDAQHVTFAHIAEETGPLFRSDKSLFAEDGFHPNERGYAIWVAVLNRALAQALITR
jgi:lysophospholipase L1-like esterase